MKFYVTFGENSAWQGCIQEVYANNKEQAMRMVAYTYKLDWDNIVSEQEGRVIIDNRNPEILEPLGVEG